MVDENPNAAGASAQPAGVQIPLWSMKTQEIALA